MCVLHTSFLVISGGLLNTDVSLAEIHGFDADIVLSDAGGADAGIFDEYLFSDAHVDHLFLLLVLNWDVVVFVEKTQFG